MMVTSKSCSNENPFSSYSTYSVSSESQQIRQSFNNEWYLALLQAAYESSQTIQQIYFEPFSDYQCPDPIRSYKIKIRVISKTKGQPVNYNE